MVVGSLASRQLTDSYCLRSGGVNSFETAHDNDDFEGFQVVAPLGWTMSSIARDGTGLMVESLYGPSLWFWGG
jgi:hypothetical protein